MHPDRFREELKRFDKRLDFEFNARKSRWEVVGVDARNKKYLIKAVPLGQIETLGPGILQELFDCSPIKQGGAKRLNRIMDELKEKEEAQTENLHKDQMEAATSEAYEHFKYREGGRLSFAGVEDKHEGGFFVRDRRRLHEISPSGE